MNKEINFDKLSEIFDIDNTEFENGLEDLLGSLKTPEEAKPVSKPNEIIIDDKDDTEEVLEEDGEDDDAEDHNTITVNCCIETQIIDPAQPVELQSQENTSIQVAPNSAMALKFNSIPEKIDNTEYLDKTIKNIMRSCETMIEAAQYQVSTGGTPESIEAAAKIMASAGLLLGEMNKAIMLDRTHRKKVELETHKAQLRLFELEKKYKLIMEKDAKKNTMGQGNQFTQNNNYAIFDQEKFVEMIKDQQRLNSENKK